MAKKGHSDGRSFENLAVIDFFCLTKAEEFSIIAQQKSLKHALLRIFNVPMCTAVLLDAAATRLQKFFPKRRAEAWSRFR